MPTRCLVENDSEVINTVNDMANVSEGGNQYKGSLYELSCKGTDETINKEFTDAIESLFKIAYNLRNLEDCDNRISLTKVPKNLLKRLFYEFAELKMCGTMKQISPDNLIKLLQIFQQLISNGISAWLHLSSKMIENVKKTSSVSQFHSQIDEIFFAADAVITSLYILTSHGMPAKIFMEDVINTVVSFAHNQMKNNCFQSFNIAHKETIQENCQHKGKKKTPVKETYEMKLKMLYDKLQEIICLLSELVCVQKMTDETIVLLSNIGISPFLVENMVKLQLPSLKLLTSVFRNNKIHRGTILEEIISSFYQISKLSLNKYNLFSKGKIGMLAALVLSLVQSTVTFPELQTVNKINLKENNKKSNHNNVNWDSIISQKYVDVVHVSGHFLDGFLNKCIRIKDEVDYRPILENFVQDLITTLNKPEWPVSELLLDLCGRLFISYIKNKNSDSTLRLTALEHLGNIATKMKKEIVKTENVSSIIDQLSATLMSHYNARRDKAVYLNKANETTNLDEETSKIQNLQAFLLNYLYNKGGNEETFTYARHFYIAKWFKDDKEEISEEEECHLKVKKKLKTSKQSSKNESHSNKLSLTKKHKIPTHKEFLISKIDIPSTTVYATFKEEANLYVDNETAENVTRYLASKRPFYQYFAVYLQQILCCLAESTCSIRTKAMKCLIGIIEVDPSILARNDVHKAVCSSFLDHSILVRENAVDLVGKYVLCNSELVGKYYNMLSQRILDTGISVRKRVIKILKQIYIKYPEFEKRQELCVKILHRLNDVESINKLCIEVFQEMWFLETPALEDNAENSNHLLKRVISMIQVVSILHENELTLFEQLLSSIFKPSGKVCSKTTQESSKIFGIKSKDTVNCLVNYTLKLEEENAGLGDGPHNSLHLVTCLRTLQIFAKICPEFLVAHVGILQPFLSIKCQTKGDLIIIKCVMQTLEVVLPMIEHPSNVFLSSLEEDIVKLVYQHEPAVVESCISCLSVISNIAKNVKLITQIFDKLYKGLINCQRFVKSSSDTFHKLRPFVKRCVFTLGLLIQYFDFSVIYKQQKDIIHQVFNLLMFFMNTRDIDLQNFSLKGLGAICTRHYEFVLHEDLKTLYKKILLEKDTPLELVVQNFNNLCLYLNEEERRPTVDVKVPTCNDLRKMGNTSSEIASAVIQMLLKAILERLLHNNLKVRHAALKVIQQVLQQGLVDPVHIIPYLICSTTDKDYAIKTISEKLLENIEKKFPRLVFVKFQSGMDLSYSYQKRIQSIHSSVDINQENKDESDKEFVVIDGFRKNENDSLEAANSYVYTLLRSVTKTRRAMLKTLLKIFELDNRVPFSQLLYIAHNLAYFPYQIQDEPLFIIHNIDLMVPLTGRSIIDNFKNTLLPHCKSQHFEQNKQGEENIEDQDMILSRMPQDTTILQNCIQSAQGCILLLDLKEHLKNLYGISTNKILLYNPQKCIKTNDKNIKRNNIPPFIPRMISSQSDLTFLGENPKLLDNSILAKMYLEFQEIIYELDET